MAEGTTRVMATEKGLVGGHMYEPDDVFDCPNESLALPETIHSGTKKPLGLFGWMRKVDPSTPLRKNARVQSDQPLPTPISKVKAEERHSTQPERVAANSKDDKELGKASSKAATADAAEPVATPAAPATGKKNRSALKS